MRLLAAWKTLWSGPPQLSEDSAAEVLDLRRELGAVRLELEELGEELARERAQRHATEQALPKQVEQYIEARLDELFRRFAGVAAQIRTQAALMEQGAPVPSADVMALALGMVRAVEQTGLEPIGAPGAALAFDPDLARPLDPSQVPAPGEPVLVRFVGYRCRGRVIHKALVERKA